MSLKKKTHKPLNVIPKAYWQDIANNYPDPVCIKTKEQDIRFSNQAFKDLIESSVPEETEFSAISDLPEDLTEILDGPDKTVLRHGFEESIDGIKLGTDEMRFLKTRKILIGQDHTEPLILMILNDVTEHMKAEDEIIDNSVAMERRNRKLAQSNEALQEFAYAAAHDLKEPIRGMHNYAEFVLADYREDLPHGAIEYIEKIQAMSKRMDVMVHSLLKYCETTFSEEERPKQPCNIEKIVESAIEDLQARIQEESASVQIKNKLPIIYGYEDRIREVFGNLILNGLKYNESDKKMIEIGVFSEAGQDVFYVKDNGIGIAQEHQDKVFRIFKRLHSKETYGGGTGIGLAIVKRIIEYHNGSIWLNSAPNMGTTFYFTLGDSLR